MTEDSLQDVNKELDIITENPEYPDYNAEPKEEGFAAWLKRNNMAGPIAAGLIAYHSLFGFGVPQDKPVVQNEKPGILEQAVDYLSAATSKLSVGTAEAASDWQLRQYLTQPVEDTLEGVDHVRVNDNNYKDEVFGSDTPVMVLFYVDTDRQNHTNYSRGLAGLAAEIEDKFGDEIKLCAYKIKDGDAVRGKALANKMYSRYPIEDMPALAFYDNDNGYIEWMGNDWNMNGGISDLTVLKDVIDGYFDYIPRELLD